MLRVGLALIDDARRNDGFETDKAKLTDRVGEILSEPWATTLDVQVLATPRDRDRILLSVPTGKNGSDSALLRVDGILLDQYTDFALSAETIDITELSQPQLESLRKTHVTYDAIQRLPQFHGANFRRVLAVNPQPTSEIQILAIELYDDGLIVHYTRDQNPGVIDSLMTSEQHTSPSWSSGIQLGDDIGTNYYQAGASACGVQVVHGMITFTPALPTAARQLRIEGPSQHLELSL